MSIPLMDTPKTIIIDKITYLTLQTPEKIYNYGGESDETVR